MTRLRVFLYRLELLVLLRVRHQELIHRRLLSLIDRAIAGDEAAAIAVLRMVRR